MNHPIYLDYNATTPVDPSVVGAMLPYLRGEFGNPSSTHAFGRAASQAVAHARAQVAALIGAKPNEIVFTGGGSEASNLAIKGVAFRRGPAEGGHFVISAIEHPSVVEPVRFLERFGFDVTVVPVNGQGVVQPARRVQDDHAQAEYQHAQALPPVPVRQPDQEQGGHDGKTGHQEMRGGRDGVAQPVQGCLRPHPRARARGGVYPLQ